MVVSLFLHISHILLFIGLFQPYHSCVKLQLMQTFSAVAVHIKSIPLANRLNAFIVKRLKETQCVGHQVSEA